MAHIPDLSDFSFVLRITFFFGRATAATLNVSFCSTTTAPQVCYSQSVMDIIFNMNIHSCHIRIILVTSGASCGANNSLAADMVQFWIVRKKWMKQKRQATQIEISVEQLCVTSLWIEGKSMKVWKWQCESESLKVLKWNCKSVKVKLWK